MSDLFYAGQRRSSNGFLSVTMKDGAKLAKRLKKLEDGGEVAIKRTVSDFTTRAPAWVSKAIREEYGVDKAAISDAGPKIKRGAGSVKAGGTAVDGAALVYKGHTLTLKHFSVSPKQRPTAQKAKQIKIPGQAVAGAGDVAMIRPPKKYKVKATIIRGKRSTLSPNTFIASANGAANLPFQRVSAARMPIQVVRTLSVPQMIESRARDNIQEAVNEKLGARFQHHIEQAMK